MPDVFTLLESIVTRALGSIPSNSFVYIEPPKRALDIDRALQELVDSWLRGVAKRVSDTIPLAAPRGILEELSAILKGVVEEIRKSEIASFELAYALIKAAAALCISAGRECSELRIVEEAKELAQSMIKRSRALEEVLRRFH